MATVHRGRRVDDPVRKGAPEALLPCCHDADVAQVQREVDRLAGLGQRVLLFAARDGVAADDPEQVVASSACWGCRG